MATTPLTPREVLQGRLDAYLAAERKILEAQAYQVGDGSAARSLDRARLQEVQQGIKAVQAEISVLDAATTGRRRITYLRSR